MRGRALPSRCLITALFMFPVVSVTGCGAESPPAPDLVVRNAWVRAALLPEQMTGPVNSAAYLTIANRGNAGDRLVEVAFAGAARVELHESFVDEQGMAKMRPVDSVEVPPGGEARLAPGGLHVMLIGLERPLTAGDSVSVLLRFEVSGERSVVAEVSPTLAQTHPM